MNNPADALCSMQRSGELGEAISRVYRARVERAQRRYAERVQQALAQHMTKSAAMAPWSVWQDWVSYATDIRDNEPAQRSITGVLYVRHRETRMLQEIVLGIGGARALASLGVQPAIWHINEGHSVLLQLERLSGAITGDRVDFDQSRSVTGRGR